MPRGTIWVIAEPEFTGVIPIRQDVNIIPADKPERLRLGWVEFNENSPFNERLLKKIGYMRETLSILQCQSAKICNCSQSAGKKVDNMNSEQQLALAYLEGVYLSDGCIWTINRKDRKEKQLQLQLIVIDKDFVENFVNAIEILTSRKVVVQNHKNKNGKHSMFKSRCTTKWLCQKILLDTNMKMNIPKWIIDSSSFDIKSRFISGLMDGDGYLCVSKSKKETDNYKKYLLGFGSNGDWIMQVRELMEKNGVRVGKLTLNSKFKENKQFTMNLYDFVSKGFYFTIQRKQKRLEEYRNTVYRNDYHGIPSSPQRLYADTPNVGNDIVHSC